MKLNEHKNLVEDYKKLKPEDNNKGNKTYYELTRKELKKLILMLKSGHRLLKVKKKLRLPKKRDDKAYFNYMNPYPWVRLIKTTLRAIEGFGIDPTHAITIIDENWQMTLDDFVLNIAAIRSKLCQELRRKDALFMIEFAFLADGKIAAHCQGIGWGDITGEDIAHLKTRFNSGIEDVNEFKEGFVAKPVRQLVGTVAYMIKPPTYAYKKPEYERGHKTTRLSNRDCYRLYRKLQKFKSKPISYFDLMIGVGEGVKLKAAIMEHLGVKTYVKTADTE